MLPDALGKLLKCLLPEDFPGLCRIGADIPGREKYYPPGFHIGSEFLTLHSGFLLMYHAPILPMNRAEKTRKEQWAAKNPFSHPNDCKPAGFMLQYPGKNGT
jgi:hypothetical protein